MPTAYNFIASTTVGAGGAASVTFTSIAATYTDLKLVISGRTSGGNQTMYFNINSDTNDANYDSKNLQGNGTSPASGTGNRLFSYLGQSGDTASVFGNLEMYFPKYSSSSTYKSFSSQGGEENNATGAIIAIGGVLWKSNSVITAVTVTPYSGSFIQYTTAYLYGIKNS